MTARALLRARGLSKHFGSLAAVEDVSLDVRAGEIHAIIGPNGAGKTTLLNLLSGELAPTAGTLEFDGADITRWSSDRRAVAGMGRSFQHSAVFDDLDTFENARLAAQTRLPSSMKFFRSASRYEAVNAAAARVLEELDLKAYAATPAGEISHGAQRQLEIAMLLAIAPKLMLLDEPTSGMGRSETAELIAILRRISANHTLILVEHDMDVVFSLADRITVMVNGRVLASGAPAEVRANPEVRTAYLGSEH
jgi:branched-chain amino acid transport system ATP-binding protein